MEADPTDDDAVEDGAWPHNEHVYRLWVTFLESPRLNADLLRQYVEAPFIHAVHGGFSLQFFALSNSEDPREREFVKVSLHRFYLRSVKHRFPRHSP